MNKLLLSNEAISIAVRDFVKFIIFLGVKLVLTIPNIAYIIYILSDILEYEIFSIFY